MTTLIRFRPTRRAVQTRNLRRSRVHSDGRVCLEMLDSETSQRITLRQCLLKCGGCIFLALMAFFLTQYLFYDVINFVALGIALILGTCVAIGGLISICEEISLSSNYFKQYRAEQFRLISNQQQKALERIPVMLEEILIPENSKAVYKDSCSSPVTDSSAGKKYCIVLSLDPHTSSQSGAFCKEVSRSPSAGSSQGKNTCTSSPQNLLTLDHSAAFCEDACLSPSSNHSQDTTSKTLDSS